MPSVNLELLRSPFNSTGLGALDPIGLFTEVTEICDLDLFALSAVAL